MDSARTDSTSVLIRGLHLFAGVLEHLFDVVDQAVERVARVDLLALLLVLGGVGLGLLGHFLDFILAEAGARGDGDARVLAGGLVLGVDVEDAVGVDVECDLDLRNAARRGRNAGELELAQRPVLRGHRALALQDVNLDLGLDVGRGREGLGLLGGDGGVARDHAASPRRPASQSPERQRRDVEEQQILDFAGEHAGLHGRADGDDFIRIDAAMRLPAEELLDDLLNLGHAGLAADEHDFVDLAGLDAGIGDGLLAGLERAHEEVVDHLLELGAGELADEVLGSAGVGGDEGQVDLGLDGGGELDLGLLRGVFEALEGHLVALGAEVEALLAFEFGDEPLHDALVDVVAAEVGVAVGGLDLDDAFADFEDGNVEGAAAEVVDGDGLVLLLVEAVGERGRGGLVDDALDVEAGDLAGVLGGLALGVVEVGGDGDDGLGDGLAEIGFGGAS